MNTFEVILQGSFGLMMAYYGLNGFFHWQPIPKGTEKMEKFNQALFDTKIILPVVKVFEIVFGLSVAVGFKKEWALLALSPIVFFIFVAHMAFNRPKGYGIAFLVAGLFAANVIFLLIKAQVLPM